MTVNKENTPKKEAWSKGTVLLLSIFSLNPFFGFPLGILGLLHKKRRPAGILLTLIASVVSLFLLLPKSHEIKIHQLTPSDQKIEHFAYKKLTKVEFIHKQEKRKSFQYKNKALQKETHFYKNGQKKSEIFYKNNQAIKEITYRKDGKKKEKLELKHNQAKQTLYGFQEEITHTRSIPFILNP